jgi:hypothetical protein
MSHVPIVSGSRASLEVLAADKSPEEVIASISGQMSIIAFALAGVMIIVCGIKVMVSMKGQQSFREAISNLGVLGLGVAIVSGGAIILGVVRTFVTTIQG